MFTYLNEQLQAACEGTGFEGKVSLTMTVDADYYNTMYSGAADSIFTTWGGAAMAPFTILNQCYTDAADGTGNQMEYGFDTDKIAMTIKVDGTDVTDSLRNWTNWVGGATDAAEFIKAGYAAVSVTGASHRHDRFYHTRLDCWKKGRKGILITLGDEPLNPYLPADRLAQITGDQVHRDVDTYALYRDALEKYEIFHIAIDDREDSYRHYARAIQNSFGRLLKDRFFVSSLNSLPATILDCLEAVREANAGTGSKPRMSLGRFLLTSRL
jgi:hypothetical protein